MPTDYNSSEFVESYAQSRNLTSQFVKRWAARLAENTQSEHVATVLDVGAGTGRFWPILRAAWSPQTILAIDHSQMMIHASRPDPDVIRVVADLDCLPLRRDAAFDVVFSSMALHYSRDPRGCVEDLAATVRPNGWLCVRSGTAETIASFEFLRFFPTALAAERHAMPTRSEVLGWLTAAELKITAIEEISVGPPLRRRRALRTIASRGFPSLQLVAARELALGLLLYAGYLAWTWLTRAERPLERSMLFVAQRITMTSSRKA